jgi:hypothetical protein
MCLFSAKRQVDEIPAQGFPPGAMLNLAPKTTQYTMKLEQTPDSSAFKRQLACTCIFRGLTAAKTGLFGRICGKSFGGFRLMPGAKFASARHRRRTKAREFFWRNSVRFDHQLCKSHNR